MTDALRIAHNWGGENGCHACGIMRQAGYLESVISEHHRRSAALDAQPAPSSSSLSETAGMPTSGVTEIERVLRKHMGMYDWSKREAAAINDYILTARHGIADELAPRARILPNDDDWTVPLHRLADEFDEGRWIDADPAESQRWPHTPSQSDWSEQLRGAASEIAQLRAALAASRSEGQQDRDTLLKFAERAYVLLDNVTDDDECVRDHHGSCQTHLLERDCSVAAARKLLDDYADTLTEIAARTSVAQPETET